MIPFFFNEKVILDDLNQISTIIDSPNILSKIEVNELNRYMHQIVQTKNKLRVAKKTLRALKDPENQE